MITRNAQLGTYNITRTGTKNDQSRKHEMTKTRKKAKKIFVFSNFRVFVIKKLFIKCKEIQLRF
jgi:hypothetical protein